MKLYLHNGDNQMIKLVAFRYTHYWIGAKDAPIEGQWSHFASFQKSSVLFQVVIAQFWVVSPSGCPGNHFEYDPIACPVSIHLHCPRIRCISWVISVVYCFTGGNCAHC
jgi:hypothetical protein